MIGMLAGLVLGVVRGVRLRSRGRPGAMASGEAEVYYDALTGGIRVRTESADTALSGDGGLLTDGDKGDVTVSGSGTVWTIADFTGDSGAGGVHGFVPAPAAGDAAAGKVLHADGTWTVPITAGRTYYLDPANASDLATYYTALTAPSTAAESTLTVAATGTTDNLLAAFATDPGVPGATLIPPGSAGRHFHVETGGNNEIARLLVEVYTCLADGTSETLIRSGYSPSFYGATSQELLFSFEDATGYTITATQRIVYKVYAARVSGPATCNITVYFNGASRASYVTTTILSPATGVTDHAASSNLVWTSSGHTGTASRLAGFDGGGASAYYQIGVDVAAYDAGIASLASADAAAGLAYPSAANTWTLLALAADKGLYATSGSALSTYDLTASGRSLGGITLAATSVVVGTGAGTAGVVASTRGAILTGGASGWTAPALGASGTFYQSNGTDAVWGTIGGGSLGSILTTRGDILGRDATTPVRVALGASGYYLRSDGTDTVWGPGGSTTERTTAGTTSVTITAAALAGYTHYRLCGLASGGGGGSGRRRATGSGGNGGLGGSGGAYMERAGTVAELLAIATAEGVTALDLLVGAVGAGGTAPTTDSTNGSAGGTASASTATIGTRVLLAPPPGIGGAGGTNTQNATPTAATDAGGTTYTGGTGGSNGSLGAGVAGSSTIGMSAPGGASGGGITSSNVEKAGSAGGAASTLMQAITGGAGGAVAGGAGSAGTAPTSLLGPGSGGGGGGGNAAGGGGAGGAGAAGSGGGGAGASTNGTTGGAGGDGGVGFWRFQVW